MKKQRLDIYLTETGLVDSRSKARALIMAGKVRVNGMVVDKAGYPVTAGAVVEVEEPPPFVSRGGLKLTAALDGFGIDPAHRVCADVGASTGGFTDVLLQRGARRVYALDVGYGQLAWKLRQDPRVVVMERTNARYVDTLPEPVELVTIDVSFISLNLILPVVARWLTERGEVVALVKPQFEAGREQVGKGGVVRDRKVHRQVLEQVLEYAVAARLQPRGLMPSPITGPAGNHEFLLYLDRSPDDVPAPDPAALVESCLSRL
ncbi:MAG: TlyA family RNA methyltransferase [Chloroflexi bacterium]|nr:MAG: TlyA family RNA methyltransferase [Chloroflexota bacterium]